MINRNRAIKTFLYFLLITTFFVVLYSIKPLQSTVVDLFYRFTNNFKFKNDSELELKVADLQNSLTDNMVDEATIKALEEENAKLRDLLNFTETKNLNLMLANVIARQSFIGINSQEQNLIIDKGVKDGIIEGLAVLSERGSVVGKVVEVKESSALVCLLNNRNCQIAVSILNRDKSLGLIEGEKGLSIKMNLIPQTEEVNVNDIVVSSGLDNLIPRGLSLGRIYQIEKKANDIWQSALIDPIINFDDLIIVAIVLP